MGQKTAKQYALTGGIGSGKSTVAAIFSQLGATIIDADAISRELMQPGQSALEATVAEFGSDILTPRGHLDRAALATIVFSDKAARTRLNNIIHPLVQKRAAALAIQARHHPNFSGIIIHDIPLLVETKRAHEFDGTVVVYAETATRIARLIARGMSEEDATSRMRAQATDSERADIATWIINNNGTREQTRTRVEAVWTQMRTNHAPGTA